MFFWKWIVLEAGLCLFFFLIKQGKSIPIFTLAHFALSIFLIASSNIWFKPASLSWYDTRLCYSYRYEAFGKSGNTYTLSASTFAPYADMFTLGNFHYLNKYPQLTHIWGVTGNRQIANKLVQLKTADEIFAFESEQGTVHFDANKAAKFDDFIEQFMGNWNHRPSKRTGFSWVQAPAHLWSFPRDNEYRGQEQITKAIVFQVTSLYDGDKYFDIRKRVLRQIEIPM
jgi:hypothetical protein